MLVGLVVVLPEPAGEVVAGEEVAGEGAAPGLGTGTLTSPQNCCVTP